MDEFVSRKIGVKTKNLVTLAIIPAAMFELYEIVRGSSVSSAILD